MSESLIFSNKNIIEKLPKNVYYISNYLNESEEKYLLNQIYSVSPYKWTTLSKRRLQNWGGIPHVKGMLSEKLPNWLMKQCENLLQMHIFDNKPNHVLINEYLTGQGIMPHTDGPIYSPVVSIISLMSGSVLNFYKPFIDTENIIIKSDEFKNIEDDNFLDKRMLESEKCCLDTDLEEKTTNDHLQDRLIGSVYLEPRSLLIFNEDAYSNYLHGIRPVTADYINEHINNLKLTDLSNGQSIDRTTRISLTIRCVKKVLKKNFFGKK